MLGFGVYSKKGEFLSSEERERGDSVRWVLRVSSLGSPYIRQVSIYFRAAPQDAVVALGTPQAFDIITNISFPSQMTVSDGTTPAIASDPQQKRQEITEPNLQNLKSRLWAGGVA